MNDIQMETQCFKCDYITKYTTDHPRMCYSCFSILSAANYVRGIVMNIGVNKCVNPVLILRESVNASYMKKVVYAKDQYVVAITTVAKRFYQSRLRNLYFNILAGRLDLPLELIAGIVEFIV
jgi:hypothetical protein